jgi:hypothetical protein
MILWGIPKSGKTTLAASAPGRKWDISLDPEGYIPILSRGDVEVWDYSDRTPAELIKELTDGDLRKRILEADIQSGDTVLFDSITQLQNAGLRVAVDKGVGSGKAFSPTLEEPGQTAYGARTQYLISTMNTIIQATRKKNAHVIFMAHEGTPERNKEGSILYYAPFMSDNAINQASGAVSEIWRVTENDNARTVQIRSSTMYRPCGTRMFKTNEAKDFKLYYDPEKSDATQPMSLVSLWNAYIDGGMQKLHVPEPPKNAR